MSGYHQGNANPRSGTVITNGTPTSTGANQTQYALVINTTNKTTVDANAQAVQEGIEVVGNANGSIASFVAQNKSSGTLASADIVVVNDGNDTLNGPYIDMGITSSAGANPIYTVLPIGGYIFVLGYDFGLGTASPGKDVILHAGGTLAADEKVRLKAAGPTLLRNATALPAGGATTDYLGTSSTAGMGIYWGSGAPTVSAAKGSLYLRSDGSGTGDRMYVNTNGSTTWTAVTTAA